MRANSLTMYLPVEQKWRFSKNQITIFKSMDCENREEHCCNLEEMRRMEKMRYFSPYHSLLRESIFINDYKIQLVDGESVVLKIKSGDVSGHFTAHACKARLEKIFLVDDPKDPRVQEAANNVCTGNRKIIVLADELPDLTERKHSFQSIWSELEYTFGLSPKANRDIISCLAEAGFYVKQGEVRCTGCRYRKNLKEFLVAIGDSRVRQLMRLTTKPLLLKTVLVTNVDHDSNNCFHADQKKKTLLSAKKDSLFGYNRREQGHFWVYQYNQKNYYHLSDSYPEPVPLDQTRAHRLSAGGVSEYFDRYLGHKKNTFLFATTVPKSSFLSQDELLYQGSTIKQLLETLRQKYHNLKARVDQLPENKRPLTDEFNMLPMEGLLSDKMARLYHRIIVKLGNETAEGEPGHDETALAQMLDQWLTMIEQCGGIVAEKGLMSLCVQDGGKQQSDYFQYGSSDTSSSDFSGSSLPPELSEVRRQWLGIGIEYMQFISETILSPLLNIFDSLELSETALRKIFCASETYIESLATRESTVMNYPLEKS